MNKHNQSMTIDTHTQNIYSFSQIKTTERLHKINKKQKYENFYCSVSVFSVETFSKKQTRL
jgi:hypothetical protein